jgi:RNA polymerase primary sigma factor
MTFPDRAETTDLVGTSGGAAEHRGSRVCDSIRLYLHDIGRVPLLTAADEVRLGHEIEVGVLAAERRLRSSDLTEQDAADLDVLTDRGKAAKATLVQANLRLVVAVARRYAGSGILFLDLIQEGNIGLIKAVERFDYRLGFKFSTYATWWIRQAIARGVSDQARTIRIPVHVVEAMQRLLRLRRVFVQDFGRAPTVAELAAASVSTPEKVLELLKLVDEPVSLDTPVGEGRTGHLGDIVIDEHSELPLNEVSMLMLSSDVDKLLSLVASRERRVLRLRFGLEDGRTHTLEEVGSRLGVTRERVRQIETKALARIRLSGGLDCYREYLRA